VNLLKQNNFSPIGGRWAISLYPTLFSIPLVVLGAGFSEPVVVGSVEFWKWAQISLIAALPAALVLYGANLTYFKNRKVTPVSTNSVFVLGAILGFIKGSLTGLLSLQAGLITENITENISTRIFAATVIGFFLLPIVSFVTFQIDFYRNIRKNLINDLLIIESHKYESGEVAALLRSKMKKNLDQELASIFSSSRELFDPNSQIKPESQWEELSKILRNISTKNVRNLSHNLFRERIYGDIGGVSHYFSFIVRNLKFESLWIALLFAFTTFRYALIESSNINGFITTLVKFVFVYCIFIVAQWIYEKVKSNKLLSFIGLIFTSLFLFSLVSRSINYFIDLRYSNISYFIEVSWLFIVVVITSFINGLSKGQAQEIQSLFSVKDRKDIELVGLQKEEERIRREIAKYLHGIVQSRLMASAIKIEASGNSGNLDELKKEIANAYTNLTMPDLRFLDMQDRDFKSECEIIESHWGALVELDFHLKITNREFRSGFVKRIGEAVTEAISNSFRHGQATSVQVLVEEVESGILIKVIDNGQGPQSGLAGMGSDLFTSIAGDNWSLRAAEDKGAILEVAVTI